MSLHVGGIDRADGRFDVDPACSGHFCDPASPPAPRSRLLRGDTADLENVVPSTCVVVVVYQLPPHHFDQLASRGVLREWGRPTIDRRPVTGAMATHVGMQHDLDTLSRTIVLEMTDLFSIRAADTVRHLTRRERASLARVRSFDVPALLGTTLHAPDEDAFPAALAVHLGSAIGGTSWLVPDDARWPLRKLLFFCAHVPAPRDETTGAPMVLQLTGPIVALGGIERHTAAWADLVERHERGLETHEPPTPLAAPFIVAIEAATYANCMSPAVGMPFYV